MEEKLELEGVLSNGYGIVAKYVMIDRDLSCGAKAVYSYLCSYTGKGNTAFPSRNKMCFDLSISNDTLGKYLKEIKDKQYITVKQENISGKFLNNIYKINYQIPLPKISYTENTDTEKTVYGKLDTKNNINKNNINNNININNNKEYFEDSELNDMFLDFLKMRKKMKAVNSDRAINGLLNILNKYDDETKKEMINNSIVNSWKSVYELKKPILEKTPKKENNQKVIAKEPQWMNQDYDDDIMSDEELAEFEKQLRGEK